VSGWCRLPANPVRRVTVVCAALWAFAVLAGPARAASPTPSQVLLVRHAPILVLHADEPTGPVAVDGFLADADLLARSGDGRWEPYERGLAGAPRASRLDNRVCAAEKGPAADGCYAEAQRAHGVAPVVYGAVQRTRARVALQYWLFYPWNLWRQAGPQGEVWQAHEGDWEAVTILLDSRERPTVVGLSRHCGGVRRDWSRAPKVGRRPVVYVSLGSHANGFVPGVIAQDTACWPSEANAVLDAFRIRPVDVGGGGPTVRPRVVVISARSPDWARFRGTWGESQFIGFPDNPPLAFGTSPQGPVYHALWRRPFATPLAWQPDPS
jgi:hypothetical protein